MAPEALADTGALLALLDRSDMWHTACVNALRDLRLPLITTEAVLTELFHLTDARLGEMEVVWKLIRKGVLVMESIDQQDLPSIEKLMRDYADRPMDFADATLVQIARRRGISVIFTVDHADFSTYRIEGRRRFEIIPQRR